MADLTVVTNAPPHILQPGRLHHVLTDISAVPRFRLWLDSMLRVSSKKSS